MHGALYGAGAAPAFEDRLRVAAEVAAGLAHVHAAGLVHRDLSCGEDGRGKEGREGRQRNEAW